MADLDADILALAGDLSDDEGTRPTDTLAKPISSPSPRASSTPNVHESSEKKTFSGPKTSVSATGAASKSAKKGKANDSEEEGEASSSSSTAPNSLDSAPMSESDPDSAPNTDGDTEGPIFPLENKFYSEKDKAEILALSEVQRESLLAERAQILERRAQDLRLRRMIQARDGAEAKLNDKKKRKAAAADLDDVHRKSSRQKTTLGGRKVGEPSGAIVEYKRQREEKGLLDEQRKRDGEDRKARKGPGNADDGYSDADADGESEVEWDNSKAQADEALKREEQPAGLIDFEHVRVGRDNFAKVCFYPGFDNAIRNCFARVSIGPDRATGQNVYRVAQIKGFTEGKPYAMEGVNGKSFVTTQYALVAVGKSEKPWPFLACSNSKFTEAEFSRWKQTMSDEDLPIPKKAFLLAKINEINALIHHQFTAEEIEERLRRSGAVQNRYASLERHAIANRRKIAIERGDEAAIAKLDAELAALEGPKLAFGTSLRKARGAVSYEAGQQERLAALNRANRKANTQDVRKAQQAERKADALARKAIERGEAIHNPLARVKIRAKIHHNVGRDTVAPTGLMGTDDLFGGNGGEKSRSATPLPLSVRESKSPMPSSAPTTSPTPANGGEKISGLPRVGRRIKDDDIFAAMDFGIDIDV